MRCRFSAMAQAVLIVMAVLFSLMPVSYGDGNRTYESVPVTLNASACTFDACVPACMPYYVTDGGEVLTSDDVTIENHSIGRIEMKSMHISEENMKLAHNPDEFEDIAAIRVITGSHELPLSGNVKQEELRVIDGNAYGKITYTISTNDSCAKGMHSLSTVIVLSWNR